MLTQMQRTKVVFLCQPAVAIACSGITLHMVSGDTTKYALISNFKWGWLFSTGLIILQSLLLSKHIFRSIKIIHNNSLNFGSATECAVWYAEDCSLNQRAQEQP